LIRLALDNNGIDRGDSLYQLLLGVQAQEDFKSLVIIRNTVDEGSVEIINNLLKR
jgi:Ran GTPase-activating protein (RanGAP) involved in mRNA processing and transport